MRYLFLEVTKRPKKKRVLQGFSLEAVGFRASDPQCFPGWVNELLQGGPKKKVRNGVTTPINGLTNG